MNDIKGITAKSKNSLSYINVCTLIRPSETDLESQKNDTSSEKDTPMEVDEQSENSSNDTDDDDECENDDYVAPNTESKKPLLLSQVELNDFIRDLGLPKDAAEFVASVLKKRNFLKPDTKVSYYRDRDREFRKFFTKDEETSLVYCIDVKGLMNQLKENVYKDEDWRLFIDSSKRSIKGVLLHNTNFYAPIPIAHSTVIKEEYHNVKMLLDKVNYASHKWQTCGDLKIITMILGQQSGFTREPCFLCLWNSRDRANHYVKKDWPKRESFKKGSHNIINGRLIDPQKILIPPLHIKLGLMKQFVKALDKDGECFTHIGQKFSAVSDAKLKAGVFDGPQIRTLFKDTNFVFQMTEVEKNAWESFKAVATNFLGNNKSPDYEKIVDKMVKNFKKLGCLMNLKLHFLDSHLDRFPDNVGDFSEEQGERFHQDIKIMEQRYQGRWDEVMMADFCWMLKRETKIQGKKRRRNPLHRSFEEKRTRYSASN